MPSASTSSARSRGSPTGTARCSCSTTSRDSRTRKSAGSCRSRWARRRVSSSTRAARSAACCNRNRRQAMHDEELTPAERAAMDALPRERPPDRALEERTVRALRAQGLLERPTVLRLALPATGWLAAAAAAVVLFAGGFVLGAWRDEAPLARDARGRDARILPRSGLRNGRCRRRTGAVRRQSAAHRRSRDRLARLRLRLQQPLPFDRRPPHARPSLDLPLRAQ